MNALSRRSFLRAGAAAGAAGTAALTGCSVNTSATSPSSAPSVPATFIPHLGPHQPGIVTAPPRHGLMAAFDTTAATADDLRALLADLAAEVDSVTSGAVTPIGDPLLPPADNRISGVTPQPDDLTVTVGYGASLFDERFGLAASAPRQLVEMPLFPNDATAVDRKHGDLVLQICAQREQTVQHALRRLMRATRRSLTLRWMQAGFVEPNTLGSGRTSTRNLLGFKDGTANIDGSDATVADELVWVGPADDGPEWTIGGTYMVTRIIRNRVEFWDRTPLATQELIIGRMKDGGAPLGGTDEADTPMFDAAGTVTPLSAHIRLANPRTTESRKNLLLRRGFNYANGFTVDGQLDQGLLFVCFQRSLADGFLAVQGRLNGEALEEYIEPVGGGFFFVPPGRAALGDPFAIDL